MASINDLSFVINSATLSCLGSKVTNRKISVFLDTNKTIKFLRSFLQKVTHGCDLGEQIRLIMSANAYFPVKLGLRFSANAETASIRSFDGIMFVLTEATYLSASSMVLPMPKLRTSFEA